MRVQERLELISQIGRELQDRYTFSELYSYLGAFGIKRWEEGPTNSKWVYVREILSDKSEELILKIAEDLGLDKPVASGEVRGLPKNWEGSPEFKLFISHISKDKDKAMRLRDALKKYAISGFVAHEDIHPTTVWEKELELALGSMDAMVAVHTQGFSESNWTQQEVGFALGRGTKIISFKMGEDPTGFLSKLQALARRQRTAEEIAEEINNLLLNDERTKDKLKAAKLAVLGFEDDIPF